MEAVGPANSHDAAASRATTDRTARSYTYDNPGRIVRTDIAGATTEEHLTGDNGGLRALPASKVAANGGDEMVYVWRTVGTDEAADIAGTGRYRIPAGRGRVGEKPVLPAALHGDFGIVAEHDRNLCSASPANRSGASFASVNDLIGVVRRFIEGWNDRCQTFRPPGVPK